MQHIIICGDSVQVYARVKVSLPIAREAILYALLYQLRTIRENRVWKFGVRGDARGYTDIDSNGDRGRRGNAATDRVWKVRGSRGRYRASNGEGRSVVGPNSVG